MIVNSSRDQMGNMNHANLTQLFDNHAAIRLVRTNHLPLIISFLYSQFKEGNKQEISNDELTASLTEYLALIRAQEGTAVYSELSDEYLTRWANSGFLRKFYREGDVALFELTPATEMVLDWIANFQNREFVGTESRMAGILGLLREISFKTTGDANKKIDELKKQEASIRTEINKLEAGHNDVLTRTQIKERITELVNMGQKLLADFRQVEQNIRDFDHDIRVKLLSQKVSKGDAIDSFLREHNDILNTDQGRSFQGFWDMLLSNAKQRELDTLIESICGLPETKELHVEEFLGRLKISLIEAADRTNRTIHTLNEQLRKFVDNDNLHETKQVFQIIRAIKESALDIKNVLQDVPDFFEVDGAIDINLIIDRPFYSPSSKPCIEDILIQESSVDPSSTDSLYKQHYVDLNELKSNIESSLASRSQVSLVSLSQAFPITKGTAELVGYFNLASNDDKAVIDDSVSDIITILNKETGHTFEVNMPQILFCK